MADIQDGWQDDNKWKMATQNAIGTVARDFPNSSIHDVTLLAREK